MANGARPILMKKAALIFGADGYLGGALNDHFRRNCPSLEIFASTKNQLDLTDRPRLRSYLQEIRPHWVFHMASTWSGTQAVTDPTLDQTVTMTTAIVEALQSVSDSRLEMMIVPGSAAEYGVVQKLPATEESPCHPFSAYGKIKCAQTKVALSAALAGLPVAVGRIFNVLDETAPSNTLCGSFIEKIRRARKNGEKQITLGDLSIKRDFISLSDTCRALECIARHGKSGEIYQIASGVSVSFRDLVHALIQSAGGGIDAIEDMSTFQPSPLPDIYGSHEKLKKQCHWSLEKTWLDCVRSIRWR